MCRAGPRLESLRAPKLSRRGGEILAEIFQETFQEETFEKETFEILAQVP